MGGAGVSAAARVVEVVLPRRLGTGFRWLIASSWASNLGDGVALAAGPLLVASLTDDALPVALAALAAWLPPLLFGLTAGVLSDRLDRRRIVLTVDLVRAGLLLALAAVVATGRASVPLVLGALFLLATAEVFADNTASTLLPVLVARDDLALANARVQTGFVTVNQLAGPPLGAVLFTLGTASPFAAQAALCALAGAFVARLRLPARAADRPPTTAWHDVREGIRWTAHHPAVRVLVLTIFVFNVTFGAAWSVLVLYSTQRLGLGAVGYGLITTTGAVGGVLGTLAHGAITRRVSLGALMRIGLVVETLTHLALALARSPWVALPVFFVFGVHAFVWGTTSITVRQRAVPHDLQGRVGAVNTVGSFGGLAIGSAVGGVLAQHHGVTAPFWFAAAGSAVLVALVWRPLRHVAHD
ncbi:putative MFS family arabinose efflux permease [Kineococcus radiotolerans]|uniref:Putative MFS family arabinose efflux permease n=1 Tax=Kineococcus radiotolerans TaxID=131568 RepID=A0A7W4TJV4_KINRA|nr:MFS transporter [Kineococcus radiotolerans]MBB2900233.1 putative MFS family arabinose efflux permease [Kineococcus radiotolerans]